MAQADLAQCVEISIHNRPLNEDQYRFLSLVNAEQPDIIGFSCYEWNLLPVLRLAHTLKAAYPDLRILLGGPEVSFDATELLRRYEAVDFVICGEGEIAFSELLRHLLADSRKPMPVGVAYREHGMIVDGGFAPALEDLNALPYIYTPENMPLNGQAIYFETSRGCPYRCAFCNWGVESSKRAVRYFSLQRIFGDLDLLKQRGISKIHFCDSSLCLQPERAKAILERVNAEDSFTGISIDVDAGHLDAELVRLIKPKILELLIGVQSIHPDALAHCQRKWQRKSFEQVCAMLREAGINIAYQVIYGLPGDNHDKYLETLNYLVSLRPAKIQSFHLQILPGTAFRERATALGMSYQPEPPHFVLGNATYSLTDLIRSRKISSLVHKLGFGFSWPCVLLILDEFQISFATFIEGFLSFIEQRGLSDEQELYSEERFWMPHKEKAILEAYLSHLYHTMDPEDLLVYPRIKSHIADHYTRCVQSRQSQGARDTVHTSNKGS
jgi:hypothetical protein